VAANAANKADSYRRRAGRHSRFYGERDRYDDKSAEDRDQRDDGVSATGAEMLARAGVPAGAGPVIASPASVVVPSTQPARGGTLSAVTFGFVLLGGGSLLARRRDPDADPDV
jgi:hypothetical protein